MKYKIEIQQARIERLLAKIIGFSGIAVFGLVLGWTFIMETRILSGIIIVLMIFWAFMIKKFIKERLEKINKINL